MKEKEALFYKKLKENVVQCQLCPHFCIIKDRNRGKCGVRENRKGRLYSLVYGMLCNMNPDPIEKKPLYHFVPDEQAMSISTVGCNLKCKFCQNWQISQVKPEYYPYVSLTPKEVVEKTIESECKIIAYTYTEPTVFYEYMLDIARLAKKKKVKNVIVSNGFINPEPLKDLCRYIDAANIDLKAIKSSFYEQLCEAKLKPILDTLKILKERSVWTEITTLLIPGKNDSSEEIRNIADFVLSLGKETPLHFSAFYPCYKLSHISRTADETVKKARKIALKSGLDYVYTGNIIDTEGSTTYCPKCKKPVIIREGFFVRKNNLKNGRCVCGEKIAGVWK